MVVNSPLNSGHDRVKDRNRTTSQDILPSRLASLILQGLEQFSLPALSNPSPGQILPTSIVNKTLESRMNAMWTSRARNNISPKLTLITKLISRLYTKIQDILLHFPARDCQKLGKDAMPIAPAKNVQGTASSIGSWNTRARGRQ